MTAQPLLAFATTRAILLVAGFLALTLFPAHPVESWQGIAFPGHNWIDGWVRWDSFWYESIIDSHPRFVPAYLSNANFFPFYSWVSWLVSLPLRAFLDLEHAFYLGALIVSSASFILGLNAVERLATALVGRDVAIRTIWLIAVFPFSFFFTAVYADALYFCLCAWSLTFAYERRWYAACALGAMAAMTRIPGVALLVTRSAAPSVDLYRDPRHGARDHRLLLPMALWQPDRVPARAASGVEPRRGSRRLRARLWIFF
jgi:hypothetical protein